MSRPNLMNPLRSSARPVAGFRVVLALLYLLLGITASWHAPHTFGRDAAVSESRHAGPVNAALADDACALCAWHSLSQEAASAPAAALSSARFAATESRPSAAPAGGFFLASRARGPPVLS